MKLALAFALAALGGCALLATTHFNAAQAAQNSIDCTKAKTATEKAICGSPAAHKADDDVNAAFFALKPTLPDTAQKLLVANQVAWLKQRNDDCGTDADGNNAKAADIAACVLKETPARRNYLAGLPAEGPGVPDAIVPVIRRGADDSFWTSLAFANPANTGEKLFNTTLDAEMAKYQLAKKTYDTSDDFSVALSYASPALLSAYVSATDQSPKLAHAMDNSHNLNIDLATGKVLRMADAFDNAALGKIGALCLGQLKDYLASTDVAGGDQSPDLIATDIGELSTWSFGSTEATLIFDPIDVPAQGICHLAYADLRPLAKPGFPLPKDAAK